MVEGNVHVVPWELSRDGKLRSVLWLNAHLLFITAMFGNCVDILSQSPGFQQNIDICLDDSCSESFSKIKPVTLIVESGNRTPSVRKPTVGHGPNPTFVLFPFLR